MDLGFLTGFGGGVGYEPGLGAQALSQRKATAMQGGQDQSAFADPTAGFFNLILKQLDAPPITPGGTKTLGTDFSRGIDPQHPFDVAFAAGQRTSNGQGRQGPLDPSKAQYSDNWNVRTRGSQMYAKYGPSMGRSPDVYTKGVSDLTQTGEAAATPDFSRLIDLSNQVWGTQQGDFGALLQGLQKDIGGAQSQAGTFLSQAGAAAGGAAGAALMARLQSILAPRLVDASKVLQGFNQQYTINGNPVPGAPMGVAPNKQLETILQFQKRMGATQLQTNQTSGGFSYAG